MTRITVARALRALVLVGVLATGAAAGIARAEAETIGDWVWDDASAKSMGSLFALTMNEAEQSMGQFCYASEGKCYWILTLPTACSKGAKIPVLVNGEAGAGGGTLHCLGDRVIAGKTHYRMVFADFDAFDELFRQLGKSPSIGVAFPTEGDKFRVARFSLEGAVAAVDQMRKKLARATQGGSNATRSRTAAPATETL